MVEISPKIMEKIDSLYKNIDDIDDRLRELNKAIKCRRETSLYYIAEG